MRGTVDNWQVELMDTLSNESDVERAFDAIAACGRLLGFEYCAYGIRAPYPLSNPPTALFSNYPADWQKYYRYENYLSCDPTVQHGRMSRVPIVWNDTLRSASPAFWSDAKAAGLCHGWAQSCSDGAGCVDMLTLARSHEPVTATELARNEAKFRWLVQTAHLYLSPLFTSKLASPSMDKLTVREVEVLRWTADGKSASEIAEILSLATDTVNFHVKNVVRKLCTANKTAAVAKAALLGMLG
ncbi:autoinducer binding domain-containing protein [Duganella sp. CY15W]|uniref:autoinducer binding domain-containing protein n=1 Tax=Duganella sp. CY15W TaxID=2692172 RepID=UPI0019293820|nr:autoinducer binding domain-containing protein [Duganella sp. CY15W]